MTTTMVRFRWRVLAGSSGSSGTLRIDDLLITARTAEDLSPTSLSVAPAIPGPDDWISIRLRIMNKGLQPVPGFEASLFLDSNRDSLATSDETVGIDRVTDLLAPGDSLDVSFELAPLTTGTHVLIATTSAANDGNSANDTLVALLSVRHPERSLVVNEIMFDPPSGSGEYIELFNPGDAGLRLTGWLVKDKPGESGTPNIFVFPDSTVCPPGGFLVLAEDSTVITRYSLLTHPLLQVMLTGGSPGLNNDGDDVVVVDHAGGVVDSVSYAPSWHHPEVIATKGRSLERINPSLVGHDARNWSTSADPSGGTPGRQNSLYAPVRPAAASVAITPNPFSPDGDGHDDQTIISFETPSGSSTFSVRVYDTDGRLIRQLATNELTGPAGSVVWDGLDDQRRKARIGMYVVYLEILGPGGDVRDVRKAVVVLAGRL